MAVHVHSSSWAPSPCADASMSCQTPEDVGFWYNERVAIRTCKNERKRDTYDLVDNWRELGLRPEALCSLCGDYFCSTRFMIAEPCETYDLCTGCSKRALSVRKEMARRAQRAVDWSDTKQKQPRKRKRKQRTDVAVSAPLSPCSQWHEHRRQQQQQQELLLWQQQA